MLWYLPVFPQGMNDTRWEHRMGIRGEPLPFPHSRPAPRTPACRQQCENWGGNHPAHAVDTDSSLGPGRATQNVHVWFLLLISLQGPDNKQWERLDCFWVGAGFSALSLCHFLSNHQGRPYLFTMCHLSSFFQSHGTFSCFLLLLCFLIFFFLK